MSIRLSRSFVNRQEVLHGTEEVAALASERGLWLKWRGNELPKLFAAPSLLYAEPPEISVFIGRQLSLTMVD